MSGYILADAAEGVNEVVEHVSGVIEVAGNTAGDIISGIPLITTKLLMAAVAIFIGVILIRLGHKLIHTIVNARAMKVLNNAHQVDTMQSLAKSVFNYIMYFIIVTVALSIFGVNVSSILAMAGVGGVAVAFGAQTLVKDVISGLFIWGEGSISVGDYVEINEMQGIVESVAIRTTVIRNYNGNLYTVPNGDIRTITNMSREFKRAIVDIRCPYEENLERLVRIVTEEMEKAGAEIDGLDVPPDVLSVHAFEVDAVVIRVAAQCPVGEHWRIERDIRSRIKMRFDREGIVMPHYTRPQLL